MESSNSVRIYDSGFERISMATKKAVCSFMKPQADAIHFDLVNVHPQPNSSDCGLFAIAFATELVHGCDPALCQFDVADLRQHLFQCLERGNLSHFKKK